MSLIHDLNDFQLKVLIAAGCIGNERHDHSPGSVHWFFTEDWNADKTRVAFSLLRHDLVVRGKSGREYGFHPITQAVYTGNNNSLELSEMYFHIRNNEIDNDAPYNIVTAYTPTQKPVADRKIRDQHEIEVQNKEQKKTTNKYPLTCDQIRAALVNEPPRTEIEDSEGYRWRRPDNSWGIEVLEEGEWHRALVGPQPSDDCTYRIIPIGNPDYSEYAAPIKRLTANEALALNEFWVVREDGKLLCFCAFAESHNIGNEYSLLWAREKGWPIVATKEEAETLVKEIG